MNFFKKQGPIVLLQEIHLNYKNISKKIKKIYHAILITNQKKIRIVIIISEKSEFRTSEITIDKKRNYAIVKGSILK